MRGIEANDERDIARTVLQVLGIVAMMVACAWILRPFLLAGLWATTIVVATWPLFLRLEGLLGGRRAPAVAVMSIALLVILIGPLSVGIAGVVDNAERITGWLKSMTSFSVPPPPQWLESLPIVGARATARWQNLASSTPEEIGARVAPYARSVLEWFLVQVGSLGFMVVQFLLTVAIAAVLYVNGETAARGVRRFAARLAGARGDGAAVLAGQAIRAVALGLVVTALVQSALGGIGLAIVGIPFAAILSLLMFLLGLCQVGPLPVLLPSIAWLYWSGDTFWASVLLVWTIPVGVLDNFLRPVLIRRGADLSMLIILPGVIGGLIAFGIIGLFVGPVMLAVTYTLLSDWVTRGERSLEAAR